jgi:hypothetical protein
MKLVMVEWLDSHAGRGWQDAERFQQVARPLHCRSVGWVVAENKECTVLVPHIAGERNGEIMVQGCGDLTIPTAAITKLTVLRKS